VVSVTVNQGGRSTTVNTSIGTAVVSGAGSPDIVIASTGLQGAAGPVGGVTDGDKGDLTITGGAWGIDTYRIDFASPVTPWIVNHNLNRRVAVETYTPGGTEFMAQVIRVNDNQIMIELDEPTIGFVVVS
jgi:hypothetical protein